MFLILYKQFRFLSSFPNILLVRTQGIVTSEQQEYILGDLQLLNTPIYHVNFIRHFLVTPVGPYLQTTVLQLVHIGIFELVEQHYFHVWDVLRILLQVRLFQVTIHQFSRNRVRVQTPNLLPDTRPLLVAVDVCLFSLLIDSDFDCLGEQFAECFRQLERVESDILSWVFLLVYLFVDINAHDDQSGCTHE